jgi:CRISPR/Cas system CSM-associated protein Csm2 small subunit
MHTEIDYDWENHYPNNYRWHYFEDKTKVKTDHFIKEKLSHFYVYSYSGDGKLSGLSLYQINGTDTVMVVKEQKTYDATGKLTQTAGFNSLGKRGFKTKYKYDLKGTEIERKVSGKKVVPSDSIIYLKRIVTYNDKNRFTSENLIIDKFGKPRAFINTLYKYDDKGNLTEEVTSNQLGQTLSRKEYAYRPDNRIQTMSVFDSSNALVDFRAWRYEIYKTANRSQRVLE